MRLARLPFVLIAALGALGALGACHQADTYRPPALVDNGAHEPTAELAGDDDFAPTYGRPELDKALIGERAAEARQERAIGDLEAGGADPATSDALREQLADLAVRRRFIASLEACESRRRNCPPRLDDPPFAFAIDDASATPPLETPLRFDLATWQKLASELHGRACACRTIACVDGLGAAIDQLEPRPMKDVQGDETASQSITRARQCLYRLRGKLDSTAHGTGESIASPAE